MPGIAAVEARVHRPPAAAEDPEPYAGADSFVFVRLRLRLSDGCEGEGYTGRFLAAEVAHFLNGSVAEALVGCDPLAEPNFSSNLMRRFNPRQMTGVVVSAFSTLDIALHDLRAKSAGVSLAALLGGRRAAAPVHVTCGFPALSTEALAAACAKEIAGGAAGVKVLVAARGRSVAEDADRVRAVRAAIGDRADLIVDANCGYDLDAARNFQRRTADLGLAWFEEPVHGNNPGALAALAADRVHPIGAGQMEQSMERFRQLEVAGVSVLQPNAVFAGGIGAAITVAQKARRSGRTVSPAGGWDIVNIHWMCGAVDQGPVELHRAQNRITRLLRGGAPSLPIADGCLAPPGGMGLGLLPDEAALAACAL
ncbi:mandelate racemase/muconate lactonizing enzyme family protein [Pelagibius litoralis]|uniref:Mandelate racemase/muconate lactonizing enzyme family protein n=1 Tax=Pelagibius litoralis TaxID=374515 RepID=A0A967F1L9_9PROT|nr:mandelate racemase/muconate lactonizing enzyme family protein [Pelagibius litoralis]NIA71486.1 mandelate racemase/muconate lactonizing enzyme family protein [Pelagibius litoralis]